MAEHTGVFTVHTLCMMLDDDGYEKRYEHGESTTISHHHNAQMRCEISCLGQGTIQLTLHQYRRLGTTREGLYQEYTVSEVNRKYTSIKRDQMRLTRLP